MASSYGRNAGFRRSDDGGVVHEGLYKTPTGTRLRQLSPVSRDDSTTEYLKVHPNATAPVSGHDGLLVQEEDMIPTIYDNLPGRVTSDFGLAYADRRSGMWSGKGLKVWFKNTASQTSHDGTVVAAVTMVNLTGVAKGDYLKVTGGIFVKATNAADSAWMQVSAVNTAAATVEAILTF